MRNVLLISLLVIINFSSYGQKVITNQVLVDKLFKPYPKYFVRDHEWVYSHLNKSAYLPGDDIWFRSYVLNPA